MQIFFIFNCLAFEIEKFHHTTKQMKFQNFKTSPPFLSESHLAHIFNLNSALIFVELGATRLLLFFFFASWTFDFETLTQFKIIAFQNKTSVWR